MIVGCVKCGAAISSQASKCPICGHAVSAGDQWLYTVLTVFIAIAALLLLAQGGQ